MTNKDVPKSSNSPYLAPLVAGAVAGFSVDVTLYPLDTLKTRLQSQQGFQKAGGFRGVYRGLLTVASTSMPITALFFTSYETAKTLCQDAVAPKYLPLVHMFAAGVAEVFSCIIRVPTEVAKQRKQTYTGTANRSSIGILIEAYKAEGLRKGVYRGFLSTLIRDIPFSFIELPLWEFLKGTVREYNNGQISSFQSALCGSIAGGLTAGVTTPLDLAKTRIMLAEQCSAGQKLRVGPILCDIYLRTGLRGLFAGATPRMMAFMLGGFVFFGMYDHTKSLVQERAWR